jgi:hypothetical protein
MKDPLHVPEAHASPVVDACLDAYKQCTRAVAEGLEGVRLAPAQIRGLLDCADASLALAGLLARRSPHSRALAAVCADVAEHCAEGLAGQEHESPVLRVAFATCHRAASACRELLGVEQAEQSDEHDEAVSESFPASDPASPTRPGTERAA